MNQVAIQANHYETLDEQLSSLPSEQLEQMIAAGGKIKNCYRLLKKNEQHGNIVREVLREQGTFFELEHYPKGCLLYTSPSPRDGLLSRMPSSA